MSGPADGVRVRMAPSPTGFVHLGSARTALYNLLFARSKGGVFALRLEDTDEARNHPEYEAGIYEGFRWLGLDWDEGPDLGGPYGPYRQSERLDLYREDAARLLASGAAYRCYCTPEELAAERELARNQKRPYVYSRRCLVNPPRDRKEFTVRFHVPAGETVIDDLVRGEVRWDNSLISDLIIVRSNAMPVYNFTAAVDDARMHVTDVLRAEEHLSNTPSQLMLLDALGYPRPHYGHLPWVLGQDGSKLSKRKHPEANLALFQERGYLPEAMLNYLALLGWSPGSERETFSFEELVEAFDLSRVHKAGAVFDWKKLDWMNGQYIRALPDEELARRLQPFLPELSPAMIARVVPPIKTKINPLLQARDLLEYLWTEPAPPALSPEQVDRIRLAAAELERTEWQPEAIEQTLEAVREKLGVSKNQLFSPIRLAVTGKPVSPAIHDTLGLLPKEEAMVRLARALGGPA